MSPAAAGDFRPSRSKSVSSCSATRRRSRVALRMASVSIFPSSVKVMAVRFADVLSACGVGSGVGAGSAALETVSSFGALVAVRALRRDVVRIVPDCRPMGRSHGSTCQGDMNCDIGRRSATVRPTASAAMLSMKNAGRPILRKVMGSYRLYGHIVWSSIGLPCFRPEKPPALSTRPIQPLHRFRSRGSISTAQCS